MFYQQKETKTTFQYDGTLFENKGFAEVEYISLETIQIYDYQIAVTPSKNKSDSAALVTIKWIFTMRNLDQTKDVAIYTLEDDYYADITTYENEEDETEALIKFSYRKFSGGFNFDKKVLNITQPLEALDEIKIDGVRLDILRLLKQKSG